MAGLRLLGGAGRFQWGEMKHVRLCLSSLLVMIALVGAGCVTRSEKGGRMSVGAEMAESGWVRTELYFSLGEWMETALSTEAESRWADFLDREVTTRFPEGLTVIEVYGQWRSPKTGSPILRERSRMLVIVHRGSSEMAEKIEAIRSAWKQATGEESVLRVSQPVEASF